MANCELCGREENLISAFVEGVKLSVCTNCSKFGKVVAERVVKNTYRQEIRKEDVVEAVVENYNEIIKNSREANGLSQSDLAIKLNERESIISKTEQGSFKPGLDLARKLERFLKIKLIVMEKIAEAPTIKNKSAGLTIGDFIKKSS